MAKYRFEEIAVNSTEKKKPVDKDKYTYLGLEHLDSGTLSVSRFGSDVAPIGEKLIMKKGDVLFGKRRAYQKKVAIAPFDGIFSAHGMVLRPKEDVVDKDFFPLFISSDYFLDEAIKISVGSLSPTINWGTLKNLEFDLPEIKEQKKLAKLLWIANDTKEAYKRLLTLTDKLVKSQFVEMFEDPIKGSKYHKKALGVLGQIATGTTPSMKKKEYYDSNDIFFIKPGDINEGVVTHVKTSEAFISENARTAARIFPEKTVLVTCIGTIGKVGIAHKESSCNQQINVIIPNEAVNYVYLAYCILYIKDLLNDYANAPVVPILNKSDFSKIEIPVPPIELQEQFAAFAQQTDKSKFELQQTISNLENTVKSLMKQHIG